MVVRLADVKTFVLGGLTVRPSACEIEGPGGTVRLEPRVMQVLVTLARRGGETVSHDELHDACWGEVAVGDDALVRAVSQLRKALDGGGGEVRVATVPRVGYRLVVGSTARSSLRLGAGAWLGAAAAALLVLAALTSIGSAPGDGGESSADASDVLSAPLTSLPGLEQWPAIAPAGGHVAYVRRGAGRGRADVYVRAVEDGAELRLTETESADETHPAWSPDGARVAFVRRSEDGRCDLVARAVVGGRESSLGSCGRSEVLSLDWSPDGRHLLYAARERGPLDPARLHLVDAATGAAAEILAPDDPLVSVEEAVFSPDGARIAFTMSPALGVEDIYVHDRATSATRRVTADGLKIHGFDWLADGSGFVLSSNRGGEFALWTVSDEGRGFRPLPGAVGGADEPDVSASGRIVYEAWRSRAAIWSLSLDAPEAPAPVVSSTRFEWDAERSPDGRRLAFVSDRSGSAEVWVAEADGANAVRLTRFGGAYTHTPRFSPDGATIVLATPASGNFDLYAVDVASAEVRRLTSHPAEDFAPAWSPDGLSLYFGSTRSGAWEIWRLDLADESLTRITRHGGRTAQPSGDGRDLYFTKPDRPGLFRLRIPRDEESASPDAEERVVDDLEPVDWNNWHALDEAVYYVRRPEPNRPELVRHDLATGAATRVAPLPELLYKSGIWIDAASSEVLFTRTSDVEADLRILGPAGT